METILKENSKTKPLLPQQLMRHREIQLPSGEYYFPSDRLLILSALLSWVPEVYSRARRLREAYMLGVGRRLTRLRAMGRNNEKRTAFRAGHFKDLTEAAYMKNL